MVLVLMGSSFLSEFTTPQIRTGLPIPLQLSLAPTAAPDHPFRAADIAAAI